MSHVAQATVAENRAYPPMFSGAFVRALMIQMAFGISYSAFLLLPKFLRTELLLDASEIGWVAATPLVSAALLAPFIGRAARIFDRKALLSVALLFETCAGLAFTQVTELGPLLFVLRAMQGFAFVLVFNCTSTLAADHLPSAHLGRGIGYLGLAMLTTNALAPAVMEPLAAAAGWDTVFITSGLASALALFLLPGVPGGTREHSTTQPLSTKPATVLPIHYGSFVMGAGIGTLFTFVQPYALERGAERVGDYFLGYVLTAVLVRVLFGGLADRVGATKVAAFALCLYVMATLLASELTPSLLIPLGALLGVSHGFLYPALSAGGLARTPKEERSAFMGWFTGAFNTGYALTVLCLGPLADRFGYPIIFVATALLLASAIMPLYGSRAADLTSR